MVTKLGDAKPFPLRERLPEEGSQTDGSDLLDRFLDYAAEAGLSLYPEQEEAILALFEGQNVILNTPTGSGKSLVAMACHFYSVARGRRSVYTCPIKALVNEKFLALCKLFGPDMVGMATGDAAVNREAPIQCCTAEILANQCLREGSAVPVEDVVMDEFHYYGDRDRGSAWQIPLLSMDYGRFLLMSATFGDTDPFEKLVTNRTGNETAVVYSRTRPVPLDYEYSELLLQAKVSELVQQGKAPIYLVNFTQRESTEQAQALLSLDFTTKEEKQRLKEALKSERFTSPFGKDVRRFLSQGIGVHHAGLLPRYRLLIERLAQEGLLKVVSGTDTLGVGVNIPIRTVVFTKLCKFDGQKTGILSVRDFMQISGRAGRKGFDDRGAVVVMAPEHVVQNKMLEAKAGDDPKKLRKLKRKSAPTKGFVHWDEKTFEKLVESDAEKLRSSFDVDHGMLLNVLSRVPDGCMAMRQLIRDCQESDAVKDRLRRRAFQLFRSLLERKIVEIGDGGAAKIKVNVELQDDFSLFQNLSIWLFDTLKMLNREDDGYPLQVLSLVEAIIENPRALLLRQLGKLKGQKAAELKAEGMDYEERMEILDEMTYPKPNAEFIYQTFNEFQATHPWVGSDQILPKGIAAEMFEQWMGFHEFIREYGLERSEGLLLRYLSDVYRVLSQTVPESYRDERLDEMIEFFRAIVNQVDSSLVDQWERMKDPQKAQKVVEKDDEDDVTEDLGLFNVLVRNEIFRLVRALSYRRSDEVLKIIEARDGAGEVWTSERLEQRFDAYLEDHQQVMADHGARQKDFYRVQRSATSWAVEQILTDPDQANDWSLTVKIDLPTSKVEGRPVLTLIGIEPFS